MMPGQVKAAGGALREDTTDARLEIPEVRCSGIIRSCSVAHFSGSKSSAQHFGLDEEAILNE